MNNIYKLKEILGDRAVLNKKLSSYTYLNIGGPADLLFETLSTKELLKALKYARKLRIPVTVLGSGSNVLISDKGIKGLVIVNRSNGIKILGSGNKIELGKLKHPQYRWQSDKSVGSFKYEFKDLDYDESGYPRIKVRIDSGVCLGEAIDYLFKFGITGLQWFAGIPGTIGGAIFNNIHGGTHFISEVIHSVRVIDKKGDILTLNIKDLGVDYDKSRFQVTGEVILDVNFLLYKGDVDRAKFVRYEWEKRKSIQPRNSPGCAFQNLTQEQKEKLGIPTTSVGFLIEHVLKMTGFGVGDAVISENHHNFIINKGKATARDYLKVLKTIYSKAKKELGIELVPEIFLMGFSDDEIGEFKTLNQQRLRLQRKKEIKTVYKDSKKLFNK